MVKYVRLLVAMMVTMFATSAMAYNPPPSPKPAGNIVDQAHVLTPQELGRLNSQLRQVNATSANEIAVLVIPTLDGNDIRDVGLTTGRAWGVGKKELDNGVMIVWVPGDRKIGIETGKGVEGDLPDLKCNDIIRNVMGPQFREHHFEAGLSRSFTAISGAIADHRQAVADRDAFNAAHPPSNAVAAGGSSPQTSTTSTGTGKGCDVSGAPVNQAGLGGALVWIVFLLGAVWIIRNMSRRRAEREREEAEAEQQRRQQIRQQELNRLNALQEVTRRENEARLQAEREQATRPVVAVPTPIVAAYTPVHHTTVYRDPPPVVHSPVDAVTTVAATSVVADRIRQEQEAERLRQTELLRLQNERRDREEEEERQSRLARLAEERRAREREEEENAAFVAAAAAAATAAAVIASSSDDDDSSSSSSYDSPSYDSSDSSSSSDSDSSSSDSGGGDSGGGDFGGGDFGGGGSADSY